MRTIARVELNRFEVTIDHEQGRAAVEDVLEAPGVGVQRVTFDELAEALADRAARDERGGSRET